MRTPKIILSTLTLLLLLTASCQMQDKRMQMEAPADFVSEASYKEEAPDPDNADAATAAHAFRKLKLIRTAEIRMEVSNHRATSKAIHAFTTAAGGFVSNERGSGDANYNETSLDIRVPNQAFDSLASRIVSRATRLDHKNISTQDVTEEFVDLQARIKTKKASEETYQQILRSSRKIADVLEVQNHIRRIREEIEVAEGRLRYLSDRVSLSTISVTFYEANPVQAVAASGDGFGSKLTVGLLQGWHTIQSALIALAYAWPLLLLIAAAIFIVRKKFYRKNSPTTTTASL